MFHPVTCRWVCLLLAGALGFATLSSATGAPPPPFQQPDELQVLRLMEDEPILSALLGVPPPKFSVPIPDLAEYPGLNANERAIAHALDRIDDRILRRGVADLKAPLAAANLYVQQVYAYERAFQRALDASRSLEISAADLPPFPTFPAAALNAYLKAAYGPKDAGILADSFVLLGPLPQALDRLSPEQLTSMQALALSFATVQTLSLEERMADIRAGESGRNARSPLGFNEESAANPLRRWDTFLEGGADFVDVETTSGSARLRLHPRQRLPRRVLPFHQVVYRWPQC